MIGFGYEGLYNHHRRGKEEKGKENGCERKDGAALKRSRLMGIGVNKDNSPQLALIHLPHDGLNAGTTDHRTARGRRGGPLKSTKKNHHTHQHTRKLPLEAEAP
jgi:hypothetical protein